MLSTKRRHRVHSNFPMLKLICMLVLVVLYHEHVLCSNAWAPSNPSKAASLKARRTSTAKTKLQTFPTDIFPSTSKSQPVRHDNSRGASSSPLFISNLRRIQQQQNLQRSRHQPASSLSSSSTALHMVLTTPESIIEQASTVNLLDDLIDESVRTSARRPIMMQFDPSSGWIWRRWTGTVFAETWTSCVRNMLYALVVFIVQRTYPSMNANLSGFGTLWGQLLSVTTFTLTFFVNQSYSLWRKCMELSRRLQGRLHDVNMNLVTHAHRKVLGN